MKIFEEEWKKAIEIKNLNKTESVTQLKAVQLIRFIEDLSCFSTFQYLSSIYLSILSSLAINNRSNNFVSPSTSSHPNYPPPLYHIYPRFYCYKSHQEEGKDYNTRILSNKKK